MSESIAAETSIGEVQLFVADLSPAVAFYEKGLGFQVVEKGSGQAVLSAGERRLITLQERPGAKPARGTTGLYHFAILLPDRKSLARLLYHLAETKRGVEGAADHGVSEALYLSDPDGNGIEVYRDRRKNEWPVDDLGRLQMGTEELDIDDLVMELKGGLEPFRGLPPKTVIGHVHLHVRNLAEAEQFYSGLLGFKLMQRYESGAIFVSAGGYHHHIGLNIWAGEGAPPPGPDAAGLRWFEVLLPDQAEMDALLERLKTAGVETAAQDGGVLVRDPAQNGILLRVE
jgi:catechol 2,3-dioxygenase